VNVFFLCTDAFGGRGGIAQFNRDLCRALTTEPLDADMTVLPRVAPVEDLGDLPDGLNYRIDAAGSKLRYIYQTLRAAAPSLPIHNPQPTTHDVVVCGHLNLLPVAALAAWLQNAPLWLIIHGIDAWEPPDSRLSQLSLRAVDRFVSVSQHTLDRFVDWAPLSAEHGHVIPDCIDPEPYDPGSKPSELLTRYGLHGQTVLLTLSRLSSAEQYKGHDEVLEALPELLNETPDLCYLICGDGDDRPRLEAKARRLGLDDHVLFAGYVPEEEKADHYRLADTFVMPGRGEGFGIVYLEAMACGVPVVASNADASEEAVRHGKIGIVVDPSNPSDLKRGIRHALNTPRGVPAGLDYFSFDRFQNRWHRLIAHSLQLQHSLSPQNSTSPVNSSEG
jgi:glycosyltransferase involved in cell wall biosynthesis